MDRCRSPQSPRTFGFPEYGAPTVFMWSLSRAMPADAQATEAAERTDPERGQKLRRGRPGPD